MAMERAGDTEFCLDAHDSSLHVIETTCCCPTTARKPRRIHAVDSGWALRHGQPMIAPWRAVGLFAVLPIWLSGIFWALIDATQTANAFRLTLQRSSGSRSGYW
jgi:hypothetical protein